MSSTVDDLPSKILKWLEDQGYPFEIFVAFQFQQAGFQVSLSDVYSDYDTGQPREIDVTAFRLSNLERPAHLQVCACIECKSSKDKPWINFISKEQPDIVLPSMLLCSSGCRVFLFELFRKPETRQLLMNAPLLKPALLGHGLVQAFKDNQDLAFSAIYSSVKSSIYRAMQFDKPDVLRALTRSLASIIVFPMIIVDTKPSYLTL